VGTILQSDETIEESDTVTERSSSSKNIDSDETEKPV
jgi:hypothetical protein